MALPHVHASALDAAVIAAYIIIIGAIIRTLAVKYEGKPIGAALAFVY